MNTLKRIWQFIVDLMGFKKSDKYVVKYLNDANIRSSIYMSFIVILIEIWMIVRQFHKYLIPGWQSYTKEGNVLTFSYIMQTTFNNTSLYLLFIICSLAVFFYAINYISKTLTKKRCIINFIFGALCILWIFLIIPQKIDYNKQIDAACTISIYSVLPSLGIAIILDTLYRMKFNKNNLIISVVVMVCFSLVCLFFGIKVGYSDFVSRATETNYHPELWKMITCFLTMVLFVGCLLIWKPYITLIMLTTIFVIFQVMLENNGTLREFQDGDKVNFITFLIALSIIAISVYKQRMDDCTKARRLEHAAAYDNLVDIHNIEYLTDKISNNKEIENKIYLFINIANFRMVNDQRSFDVGNKFLIDFGKKVESTFVDSLVARQGDDHFVVYAKEDTFMDKINLLNNELKVMAEGMFLQLKVGGYKPKEVEEPNRAIDKARYACGSIKRKPEVIYCEYDEKMDQAFTKKQYIINHIDEAIEKDWIRAFFQPVVWSTTKELCGAEALARWIDPNYGFLSPGDFIPVLEDTRLIHKLDKHIIDYVCRALRSALDNNEPVVPVSINFSRLDFELMDAVNVLKEALIKYNIPKEYVHVEITESALSEDVELLTNAFKELKTGGYSIWLDDFGSGYSSLNVLKDFEFDVVKIDMKFLSNFENNAKSKDILDCIIHLANRLGMRTLTEGVETKVQAEFLEKIGCDRLQGYLFGKPYKLEDFKELIRKGELKVSKDTL